MRVPKFQLTALSVLLCASSVMASHNSGPAVSSIIFTVIYGIVSILHIIWLVRLRRRRLDSTPLTLEKQSLVNSTLPEGVVSTNISVSEKNRPTLLQEVRSDEQLGYCGGKIETVRAYDLDGIHQTTLIRSGDGCGTLTFSTGVVDESLAHHHHHYGVGFAFSNIPNVTAVKELIEQYKTLRKKQAGNQ